MTETAKKKVTVLGAGYTGLTTAAELALRNFKVHVIASDLGYRPPLTIVGTQSRRWPGSATSNTTFDNDDLLEKASEFIAKNHGQFQNNEEWQQMQRSHPQLLIKLMNLVMFSK